MAQPEASQQAYWNGQAGERWVAGRDQLDRGLRSISDALVALAAPRAGERVLDVGCGCGTTTLLLHERVGPDGTVLGVDISAPMLAVARARSTAPGVTLTLADAATHRFEPAFDLVFSRFGVMFFDDPVAAFANLRSAMAPGGRLAFVCWRAVVENLWVTAPMAAARDLLPPSDPVDPLAPGPFAFADRDRLHGILAAAGFGEIHIDAHDDVMELGETPGAAADQTFLVGPLSRAVADLPDEVRREIRERVVAALAPFATTRGITPPAAVWLVSAR